MEEINNESTERTEETSEVRVNDYISVSILNHGQFKHEKGFQVSLRISAQKPAFQVVFGKDFERHVGWESVRQSALHSLRIKIQSFVKAKLHSLTKVPLKNNTIDALAKITPEQVKSIKDLCVDWQYGATVKEDPIIKKALSVADLLEDNVSEDLIKEIKQDPHGYIESMKAKLLGS